MSNLVKAKNARVKVGNEIEFRDARYRTQQIDSSGNDRITLSMYQDEGTLESRNSSNDGRVPKEYYLNIQHVGNNSFSQKEANLNGVFLHGIKFPKKKLDAANKEYVDTMVSTGLNIKTSCDYGTHTKVSGMGDWYDSSRVIMPLIKGIDISGNIFNYDKERDVNTWKNFEPHVYYHNIIDFAGAFPRWQGAGTFKDVSQNDITCSIKQNLARWGWKLNVNDNKKNYILGENLSEWLDIGIKEKIKHGTRILVRHQEERSQNGIYEVVIGHPLKDTSGENIRVEHISGSNLDKSFIDGWNMYDFSGVSLDGDNYEYYLVRAKDFDTAPGLGGSIDDKIGGALTLVKNGNDPEFTSADQNYVKLTLSGDWFFDVGDRIRQPSSGAYGNVVYRVKDNSGMQQSSDYVLVNTKLSSFTSSDITNIKSEDLLQVRSHDLSGWYHIGSHTAKIEKAIIEKWAELKNCGRSIPKYSRVTISGGNSENVFLFKGFTASDYRVGVDTTDLEINYLTENPNIVNNTDITVKIEFADNIKYARHWDDTPDICGSIFIKRYTEKVITPGGASKNLVITNVENANVKRNSEGIKYTTIVDNSNNWTNAILEESKIGQTSFNKGFSFVTTLTKNNGQQVSKAVFNAGGKFYDTIPENIDVSDGQISAQNIDPLNINWTEFSQSKSFNFNVEDSGLVQNGNSVRIDNYRRAIFDEDGADSGVSTNLTLENGNYIGNNYKPSKIGGHTEIGTMRKDARIQLGRNERFVPHESTGINLDASGNSDYHAVIETYSRNFDVTAGQGGISLVTHNTDDYLNNNNIDASNNTGHIQIKAGNGGNNDVSNGNAGSGANLSLNTGHGGNSKISGSGGSGGLYSLITGNGGNQLDGSGNGGTGGNIEFITGTGGDADTSGQGGKGGNISIVLGSGGSKKDSSGLGSGHDSNWNNGVFYGGIGGGFSLKTGQGGEGGRAYISGDTESDPINQGGKELTTLTWKNIKTSGYYDISGDGGKHFIELGSGGNTKYNNENAGHAGNFMISGGTGGSVNLANGVDKGVSRAGSGTNIIMLGGSAGSHTKEDGLVHSTTCGYGGDIILTAGEGNQTQLNRNAGTVKIESSRAFGYQKVRLLLDLTKQLIKDTKSWGDIVATTTARTGINDITKARNNIEFTLSEWADDTNSDKRKVIGDLVGIAGDKFETGNYFYGKATDGSNNDTIGKQQILIDLSQNFVDLQGAYISKIYTGFNTTELAKTNWEENTYVRGDMPRKVLRNEALTDYSILLDANDENNEGVVKVRASKHVQLASNKMHFTSKDISMNEMERDDDPQVRPWETETDKGVFFDLKQGLIECTEIVTTSDEYYKTNIVAVTDATDKISQLKGVYFDWKSAEIEEGVFDKSRHQLGFIAQQVEDVVPEVVKVGDRGTRAIAYDKITALLVEGIKEQQQSINKINKELDKAKKFEKYIQSSSDSEEDSKDLSKANKNKIDKIEKQIDEINDYCKKEGESKNKTKINGNENRIKSLETQVSDLSDKMDQVLSFLEQLNEINE